MENKKTKNPQLRMVNCDRFSDVTFLIGPEKLPVKAHKAFLVAASEVFEKMFCGTLQEANEIVIPDMKQIEFLAMLDYIYASELRLTPETMMGVLYASQKYMLDDLKAECEQFIAQNISKSNALEIFNEIQLYESLVIDGICFEVILRNPLHFFRNAKFLELNGDVIKKIVKQPAINCTTDDLKSAVIVWLKKQHGAKITDSNFFEMLESKLGLTTIDFENKKFFKAKLDVMDALYDKLSYGSTTIFRKNNILLHGIGLYVGVFPQNTKTAVTGDYFKDSVTIYIGNIFNSASQQQLKFFQRNIIHPTTSEILDIMFEEIEMTHDQMYVTVDFNIPKQRTVSRSVCSADHDHWKTNCLKFSLSLAHRDVLPFTSVAYLIYSDK
jgi:hypothetical protein